MQTTYTYYRGDNGTTIILNGIAITAYYLEQADLWATIADREVTYWQTEDDAIAHLTNANSPDHGQGDTDMTFTAEDIAPTAATLASHTLKELRIIEREHRYAYSAAPTIPKRQQAGMRWIAARNAIEAKGAKPRRCR